MWLLPSAPQQAQRLKIDNTLITEGNTERAFEVSKAGEIVWEYIAPARAGGPGVIGLALYRAYRIPYGWVPWQLRHYKCPEPEPESWEWNELILGAEESSLSTDMK